MPILSPRRNAGCKGARRDGTAGFIAARHHVNASAIVFAQPVIHQNVPDIVPPIPPNVPRRNRPVLRRLGRLGMQLMGWRIDGQFPDLRKFVIIVAPHTSNWDFLTGLFCDLALDMDASW